MERSRIRENFLYDLNPRYWTHFWSVSGGWASRSGSVVALEPSVWTVDSMQDDQGAVKPRT
jgi:hypothetical protein